MISLDKIAKKRNLADIKGKMKKPWEKKENIEISLDEIKQSQKKSKPRFEIPDSRKQTLSSVSESLKFISDVLKM